MQLDLTVMDIEKLQKGYEEMMSRFNSEPILFTDWRTGIRATSEEFERRRMQRMRVAEAVAEEAVPDNVIYLPIRYQEDEPPHAIAGH